MAPASNSDTSLTLPSISLVNAEAYLRASKLAGSQSFRIHLSNFSNSTYACRAKLSEETIDLSNIPSEYYEFADVFSESQANSLAPHCPYDLKINLDEKMSSWWDQIYFLSQFNLQALHVFIEEILCIRFI